MADALDELANRPGWTVTGRFATYRPKPGGWSVLVAPVRETGRTFDRYRVTTINPAGAAVYVRTATTVPEAVRVAEGALRGRE